MMPLGLTPVTALAAAALLAPATAQAEDDVPRAPRDEAPTRNDLYMPSPTRSQSGIATSWYEQYGRTISWLELQKGVRMTGLSAPAGSAAAPAGAAVAPAGAAVPSGSGRPSGSSAPASSAAAAPSATQRAGLGGVAATSPVRGIVVGVLLALVAAAAMLLLTPALARAAPADGFLGITTEDVYTGTEAYATTQLAAQRKAGITLARQDFRWNEIEWAKRNYDWSATDRFVARTAAAGIRVMPQIKGEPHWATSRKKGQKSTSLFPPKGTANYAHFAAQVAKRYGPAGTFWVANPGIPATPITSYQLWNEPNLRAYWGDKPNAAAYAKLVIAAGKAIRAVDPDAYIVSAGIPDSRAGQAPAGFIKAMLRAGAGKQLDAIAIHPYALTPSAVLAAANKARRDVNAGNGGRALELWVTELGWASGGPKSPQRTVTLAQQGPRIVGAYRSLIAARSSLKLRGIVYFAWRDSKIYKGGRDFWGLHTGLLDRSGKPKPALAEVTRVWPNL